MSLDNALWDTEEAKEKRLCRISQSVQELSGILTEKGHLEAGEYEVQDTETGQHDFLGLIAILPEGPVALGWDPLDADDAYHFVCIKAKPAGDAKSDDMKNLIFYGNVHVVKGDRICAATAKRMPETLFNDPDFDSMRLVTDIRLQDASGRERLVRAGNYLDILQQQGHTLQDAEESYRH